jgi:hypothetical protein
MCFELKMHANKCTPTAMREFEAIDVEKRKETYHYGIRRGGSVSNQKSII